MDGARCSRSGLLARFVGPAASFASDGRGVTAIEFALVAAPFLALLIAIFETCLVFLAQEVLQTATSQAGRLIMTGQAQSQSMTAAQFKQQVCNDAPALFSCSGINVNVQTFTSFSGMTQLNPLQSGNFNAGSLNYSMGGPGDIVLVQVFYQWPVNLGPLGFNLSNMNGNSRLLTATAVFRNEPY
jgi:Flp pilus assembly protein TadG